MKLVPATLKCAHCGHEFRRRNAQQRHCSRPCQIKASKLKGWGWPERGT